MLISLLSMLGGGFMRLLPELLVFLNKKTDNAHELAMLDKQFELEKTRAQSRMDELHVSGDYSQALAFLDTQKEALKGQMQITGVKFIDALNFSVRPITTYYVLFLYGLAKVATFVTIQNTGMNGWDALIHIYDSEDRAILSGILAFWFVGRVFDKK